ncbi:hypothetical protein [Chryseobacterium vrystaatense]|uniref:Lipoprotein n=1 Tax=Chryseobacterium vrystaatense TaxID=307480 RepID=A0A1M4W7I9_9FLAO|nr:hypothetical protein [Chryseobacterium vrystaatense]SHE77063.1 hypothetical protein SAMN02787073_1088 [Chryseobacterium vrystaatense]
MINRFLLILVCLLGTVVSCKWHDSKDNRLVNNIVLNKESNLPEIWRCKSEDKIQEFTLKIMRISKDSLYAQYCAVYNNGQKLDCDFEENINIKAAFDIRKSGYVGDFFSFFNSGKGKCIIKRIDKSIIWEILEIPNGEYYAPIKCVLKKMDETEEHKKNFKELKGFTKSSNILPIDYKNFAEKIKLDIPADDNIKNLFQQKYQLGIDAIAEIPSTGNYSLYIVNNSSGDSDLIYLITVEKGKLVDGLEIANSSGHNTEMTTFYINKKHEIYIYSEENDKRKLIESYSLNNKGHFNKQKK